MSCNTLGQAMLGEYTEGENEAVLEILSSFVFVFEFRRAGGDFCWEDEVGVPAWVFLLLFGRYLCC